MPMGHWKGRPLRFSSPLTKELLEKFNAAAGDSAHNTLWEAVALLVRLRLWLPRTNKRVVVRVKSDNIGALRTLLKLTSPKDAMGIIAREAALDIASGNYQVHEPTFQESPTLRRTHLADFGPLSKPSFRWQLVRRQETPSQPLTKATGAPDKEKRQSVAKGKGAGEKVKK